MAYEVKLSPDAQEAIRNYVFRFGSTPRGRIALADRIQKEINNLRESPHEKATGRFFRFPMYQFSFSLDGLTHNLQVPFTYSEDEKSLAVLDFGTIPL